MTRSVPGVAASVRLARATPRQVAQELRARLRAGAVLAPAGAARRDPGALLRRYRPRHRLSLFGTTFYLSDPRQNPDIRFLVAYLAPAPDAGRERIFPRLFYKDISLVWRSASHYARSEAENWIGKGDVTTVVEDGVEMVVSDEATTDLPLEMQTALETISSRAARIPRDDAAVALVLRRGPDDRIEPFRDFSEPRRRARRLRRGLVNGGRAIARFRRRNDPTSLVFTAGYEPDFRHGIAERARSRSRMYGGRLRRYRIASRNRRAQYLFFAGPHHAWIGACQGTGSELSSFGVRVVDAVVPDDLLLPGYEYHFLDDSQEPAEWVSQIPPGFAGPPSEVDPSRADASAWLEQMPVIRAFRRQVLGQR